MAAQALEAILADMPPNAWLETRQRFEVISRYLALERPSTKDADACARELGIKRRMFYTLVRIFSEAQAGNLPPPSRQGQNQHLSAAAEQVIQDTIDEMSEEANFSQIHAEAARRSEAQGINPPSFRAVRWRLGEAPRLPRLHARLSVSADVLLDSSCLALDVYARDGSSTPAVLSALLDVPTGLVLGHQVTAGAPTAIENVVLIENSVKNRRMQQGTHHTLCTNRDLAPGITKARELLAEAKIRLADRDPLFAAGSALLHVFGLRVGRVPLSPRRRSAGGPGGTDPMNLEDVRPILEHLVAKRNEAIEEARAAL